MLLCPSTVADPGFVGTLTLEVFNTHKTRSFQVWPGDALFHMIINPCIGEPSYTQKGRYQGQTGITLPKALKHGG